MRSATKKFEKTEKAIPRLSGLGKFGRHRLPTGLPFLDKPSAELAQSISTEGKRNPNNVIFSQISGTH